jgi:prophage antirepressor-like protein
MIIQKHSNSDFGSLTTLKSDKTGKIMFLAKEVAAQWGHTNLTQSLNRIVSSSEKILIKRKDYPKFMQDLHLNDLLSRNVQSVWLITESALYSLALASNLEKAQPFKDWVTKEVLPSIRETGSYSLNDMNVKDLGNQTMREVQVSNSKQVNSKNYNEKGVGAVIDYNRDNCKQVTGLEPNQIKKHYGYKSKSAKEILRKERPEFAATMSLNDHLVTDKGAELKQLKALDEAAIKLFKEFTKLGFRLVE